MTLLRGQNIKPKQMLPVRSTFHPQTHMHTQVTLKLERSWTGPVLTDHTSIMTCNIRWPRKPWSHQAKGLADRDYKTFHSRVNQGNSRHAA